MLRKCERNFPVFSAMFRRLLLFLTLWGASGVPAWAEASAASVIEAKEREALPRVRASDEKALRALLGQRAVVAGKVARTFESDKGVTFIDLDGGKFTALVWKERYDRFPGGSPARFYQGKEVEITGKVVEYQGRNGAPPKLQIRIDGPEQVKISGEAGRPVKPGAEKERPPAKRKTKPADGEPSTKREPAPEAESERGEAPAEKPVDPRKYFK